MGKCKFFGGTSGCCVGDSVWIAIQEGAGMRISFVFSKVFGVKVVLLFFLVVVVLFTWWCFCVGDLVVVICVVISVFVISIYLSIYLSLSI